MAGKPRGEAAEPAAAPAQQQTNLALKFDDEPPEYPFVNQVFELSVYLVHGDSPSPGVGVRTPIELRVFLEDGTTEVDAAAYEIIPVAADGAATTPAEEDHPRGGGLAISAISGCCAARVRMRRSCVELEHKAVKIRASAAGSSARARSIHEAWSTAFVVVRHRLSIEYAAPWKPVFYKDMGGKDNCLEATVKLLDGRGRAVTDRRLRLAAVLYRTDNKDAPVVDQSILKVLGGSPGSSSSSSSSSSGGGAGGPVLLEKGAATLRYRIEDVSMHHGNSTFEVRVAADTSRSLADGDVAPAFTQPVNVKSKINHKRKAERGPGDDAASSELSGVSSGGAASGAGRGGHGGGASAGAASAFAKDSSASHHRVTKAAAAAALAFGAGLQTNGSSQLSSSSSRSLRDTTTSSRTGRPHSASFAVSAGAMTSSFGVGGGGPPSGSHHRTHSSDGSSAASTRGGLRGALVACLRDAEADLAEALRGETTPKTTTGSSASASSGKGGVLLKRDTTPAADTVDSLRVRLAAYAGFAADALRLLVDCEWRVGGHEPLEDGSPDLTRPHYVMTNPNDRLAAIVDAYHARRGPPALSGDAASNGHGSRGGGGGLAPHGALSTSSGASSSSSSRLAADRAATSTATTTTSSRSPHATPPPAGAPDAAKASSVRSPSLGGDVRPPSKRRRAAFSSRDAPDLRTHRDAEPVMEFCVDADDPAAQTTTTTTTTPQAPPPLTRGLSAAPALPAPRSQASSSEVDALPPRPAFEFYPSSLYVGHDLPAGSSPGQRAAAGAETTGAGEGASPPHGTTTTNPGGERSGATTTAAAAAGASPREGGPSASSGTSAAAAAAASGEAAVRVVLAKQFKPPSSRTRPADPHRDDATTLGFPAFDHAGRLVGLYYRDLDAAVPRHAFVAADDPAAGLSASDIDVAQRAFRREIDVASKCVYYRQNYANLDELKADVENYHSSKEILATLADDAVGGVDGGVAGGAEALGGLKAAHVPASGAALSTLFMAST